MWCTRTEAYTYWGPFPLNQPPRLLLSCNIPLEISTQSKVFSVKITPRFFYISFNLIYLFYNVTLILVAGLVTVSFDGWKKIDRVEVERGKAVGKPREKIVSIQEMLKIGGQTP